MATAQCHNEMERRLWRAMKDQTGRHDIGLQAYKSIFYPALVEFGSDTSFSDWLTALLEYHFRDLFKSG